MTPYLVVTLCIYALSPPHMRDWFGSMLAAGPIVPFLAFYMDHEERKTQRMRAEGKLP